MRIVKAFGFMLLVFLAVLTLHNNEVRAATTPYDVESNVKNHWSDTLGLKNFPQTSGKRLTYDVYSQKFTSGGYKIVSKDFGKGSKKYVNFQGWAILDGYKHHTKTNHETYIVAKKVVGKSGIGTTKIYGTIPYKNLSATEDLEYNNKGAGLYNPCPDGATNKNNETDCNMRYENVGFNAFLPLDELFSNKDESASWTLFIVKRLDDHIVYTPLNLPFNFSNKSYGKGDISLSSGIEGGTLQMNSVNVLKRHYPRQLASDGITGQYFTPYKFYKNVDVDESETAVWYGVKTPEDDNKTRWANTSYWTFGGRQALLSYRVDTNYTPPPQMEKCIEPVTPEYRYKYQMDFEVSEIDGKTVEKNKNTTTKVKVKRLSFAESREKAKKEIQKDIDDREAKKAKLTDELKKLENEKAQLEKELEKADGTDDYDKINKLIKDLDNKKQQIANKQCNINTVQTEISHYKKELATLKTIEGNDNKLTTDVILKFNGKQQASSQSVTLKENQSTTLTFKWKLTGNGEVLADVNPERQKISGITEDTYKNNIRKTPIYIASHYSPSVCVKPNETSYAEGVVRTISSVSGDKVYKEKVYTTLSIPKKYLTRRAGYGFEYTVTTKYVNEDDASNGTESSQISSFMPTMVKHLPYENETWKSPSNNLKISGYRVSLEKNSSTGEKHNITSKWNVPKYYVEEFSGNVFTTTDDEHRNHDDKLLDGGRKWYLDFDQPDGTYTFTSLSQNAGVNKLNTCITGDIKVEGSIIGDPNGNDDFIKRTITPDNPFPGGIGWNWKGKTSQVQALSDWYDNWYADPSKIPANAYDKTFYLTPNLIEKIRDYDSKNKIEIGKSIFDSINIPSSK
ncbi:ABC transporter C-terminal domain-containing protein [Bacillus subtilis]|uniref:ABC transporter C-terminal domain-containing protein n=1 Tax=Bacillus subtilis TaxID=1423 RepID=UPI001BA2C936|nr:ABC transporter C-terminal domain-containing protein [Bacillus subtilis]CAI6330708.1 hypothetical protein NRS6096_21975 [Bacillus subtilis]